MANKSYPTTTNDRNSRRDELFEALSTESDRGVVMVSAAFLDEALEALLRTRFSVVSKKPKSIIDSLFNGFGPLSTYSAKIKTAYSIDLIEKWIFQDLETLRKIRNEFAHTIKPALFDSTEVIKLTEKFIGADHAVNSIEKQKKKITNKKKGKTLSKNDKDSSKERLRTIMTVSYIGALLYARTEILLLDIPLNAKLNIISNEYWEKT